jgi:hypothetical protein
MSLDTARRSGSLPKVLCITGAPRTGTHLMNSIVCSSPRVVPMLQEALPLIDTLEAYRTSLVYRERYGDTLGVSTDAITALFAQWLKGLVLHMAEHFDKDVVVLRGPLLAKNLNHLIALAQAASLDFKTAFMVRWPPDAIASMYAWEQRLQTKGKPSAFSGGEGDPQRAQSCADFHMSYYGALIRITDFTQSGIKVVRYEDVVSKPGEVAAGLGSLLDVDLGGGDCAWNNSLVTYTPELGDFVTPLYGQELSTDSVGHGDSLLPEKDAEVVLARCRYVVREFYPERDPSRVSPAGMSVGN